MDRRQILVVAAIILLLIVALVIAAQVGQPNPIMTPQGTFRARSGTMRDKAQMLLSKKTPGGASTDLPATGNGDEVSTVATLSETPSKAPLRPLSPAERVAKDALNSLTPQQGINEILTYLEGLQDLARAGELYAALGTLLTRTDPPDMTQAQEAFTRAGALAETPGERYGYAVRQVRVLLNADAPDAALKRAEEVLAADETVTPERLELLILDGKLRQDSGDAQAAEAAYRRVTDMSADALKVLGAPGVDVYRQACLRLARLYRDTQRAEDAEAIAVAMRERIAAVERDY